MIYETKKYTEGDRVIIQDRISKAKFIMDDLNKHYIQMYSVRDGNPSDDGPPEMRLLRAAYRCMEQLQEEAGTMYGDQGIQDVTKREGI